MRVSGADRTDRLVHEGTSRVYAFPLVVLFVVLTATVIGFGLTDALASVAADLPASVQQLR